MSTGRNTTTRDRHREIIRRTKAPCGICHKPIDYSLPYLDPFEFVVDHIIPLKHWPEGDVIENKQAAHRKCNRDKSDKIDCQSMRPTIEPIVTRRAWSVA